MAEAYETMLVGNAQLSAPIKNSIGEIQGFLINIPQGPDISVDIKYLSLQGATITENNQLKQTVYDTYALGVRAVPAFTPLLECIAKSTKYILHTDANQDGMFSRFISVKNPEKIAGNNAPNTIFVVNIQGDPNLPDKVYPFEFNGIDASYTREQLNKYYLGKDKLWYITNPLELITHELAHGCKNLQNFSREGDVAYEANKKNGMTPEDEKRVIDFVDKTILEPRGMPGRDLNSDSAEKPMDGKLGMYIPLNEQSAQKLMQGPIPDELKQYSHPIATAKVGALRSNSNDGQHTFFALNNLIPPHLTTKLQQQLASLDTANQRHSVFARIVEVAHYNQNVTHSYEP